MFSDERTGVCLQFTPAVPISVSICVFFDLFGSEHFDFQSCNNYYSLCFHIRFLNGVCQRQNHFHGYSLPGVLCRYMVSFQNSRFQMIRDIHGHDWTRPFLRRSLARSGRFLFGFATLRCVDMLCCQVDGGSMLAESTSERWAQERRARICVVRFSFCCLQDNPPARAGAKKAGPESSAAPKSCETSRNTESKGLRDSLIL